MRASQFSPYDFMLNRRRFSGIMDQRIKADSRRAAAAAPPKPGQHLQ
jgi:hypothetical protein